MRIDRRLTSRPSPVRSRRPALSAPGFRFWLAVCAAGLLGGLAVLLLQILLFARSLDRLPAGLVVAGVPVSGLTHDEAADRLAEIYAAPVVLDYRGNRILLDPARVGFSLEAEAMLAGAPQVEVDGSLWSGLWRYLWASPPSAPAPIPLQAAFDESGLETFIAEVAARYDDPGTPARADPATLSFVPGTSGYALDRDLAFGLINTALRSPAARAVTLPVNDFESAPPTFDTLAELIYADIRMHQFDGTVQLYLADLQSGQSLDIAMHDGAILDVGPGLAFSGMSTIKLPVMVTFFRYKDGALSPDETLLLEGIFSDSLNAYTDLILGLIGARNAGGGLVGANMMSDMAAELGLENTFLAGLLDTLGAITTPRVTPANSRTDIDLGPDPYNQSSAEDLGRLLVMIYECAEGRGRLVETFPDQLTVDECQLMLDILSKNEVGPIFLAGGAPGATVIHKHGWDLVPLNNAADAAIVYSDGGVYAMAVYMHRDQPVPFDEANRLIVSLATAVFNFYNPRP